MPMPMPVIAMPVTTPTRVIVGPQPPPSAHARATATQRCMCRGYAGLSIRACVVMTKALTSVLFAYRLTARGPTRRCRQEPATTNHVELRADRDGQRTHQGLDEG